MPFARWIVETVIRRSVAGVDLLGVQAGGLLEKAGQRRVLVVLLVGLGGAAQRAQVLEHPLGVAAPLGVRGVVAPVLVVADQPAGERHGRDHDVADRAAGGELAHGRCSSPAPNSTSRSRARWARTPSSSPARALAAIRSPRCCSRAQATSLVTVAVPIPRRGEPIARRNACASSGFCEQRQVGERVADLGALVQAERAEHAVRDAGVRERALQRLGRVPGPREREDLARRGAAGERVGDLRRRPSSPRRTRWRTRGRARGRRGRASRSAPSAPGARCGQRSDGGLEDLRARAEVPAEHDLACAPGDARRSRGCGAGRRGASCGSAGRRRRTRTGSRPGRRAGRPAIAWAWLVSWNSSTTIHRHRCA